MKKLYILLILLLGMTQITPVRAAEADSVRISLMTCSPGSEIYALFGHTAIRVEVPSRKIDWVYNYGMFSFNTPNFILRFVTGETDYQLGIIPYPYFEAEYAGRGSYVVQQELNLLPDEKARLVEILETNYLPENRTYRYNYFYDNCTTRPRDLIVGSLSHNDYPVTVPTQTTYREEIHKWNEHHRWARFGNDLLLGVKSDVPLTSREAEFLPDNLRKSFDKWDRVYGTHYLLAPQAEVNDDEGLTPLACAIIVAVLIVGLTVIGYFRKWSLLWLDSTLMVLVGLPGIILFAMLFSQHPTVNCNFQLLLLNPLALWGAFLLWQKKWRRKVAWVWLACILICILGSIWQRYAEGIIVLAFALLIRCIDRLRHDE